MMNREWSCVELEQSVGWLKRMNAKGNDVYIRPAGEHGLVLVDDLKKEYLDRMCREGFAPAATIETSPGNYQAWVKFSNDTVNADVRGEMARVLARQYGGDPNSADSRHYWRLAGFTNQKPEHTRDGRRPYVLAHSCHGDIAAGASEALWCVARHLDEVADRMECQKRIEAIKQASTAFSEHDPMFEYHKQAKTILGRFGANADHSRMDWMIATDMARSGRFTEIGIEDAIKKCSPNIESRKAGHFEDYAKRTAEKAWRMPDVVAAREENQKLAQKTGRGKSWRISRSIRFDGNDMEL